MVLFHCSSDQEASQPLNTRRCFSTKWKPQKKHLLLGNPKPPLIGVCNLYPQRNPLFFWFRPFTAGVPIYDCIYNEDVNMTGPPSPNNLPLLNLLLEPKWSPKSWNRGSKSAVVKASNPQGTPFWRHPFLGFVNLRALYQLEVGWNNSASL